MSPDLLVSESQKFLHVLNNANIEHIREATKNQASSLLWHKERRLRLTASNFGRVCKLKPTTSTKSLVNSILYQTFFGNEATRYGKENERVAKDEFSKKFSLTVKDCGLHIDTEFKYLAASPDGEINDDGLIEVKCPFVCKNVDVDEAIRRKKVGFLEKAANGEYKLKRNHLYYHQVQGQLNVAKKDVCYFVVWNPTQIIVERIRRDRRFWTKVMVPKLTEFYMEALLPEIVDPRVVRNLPIRDYYL